MHLQTAQEAKNTVKAPKISKTARSSKATRSSKAKSAEPNKDKAKAAEAEAEVEAADVPELPTEAQEEVDESEVGADIGQGLQQVTFRFDLGSSLRTQDQAEMFGKFWGSLFS